MRHRPRTASLFLVMFACAAAAGLARGQGIGAELRQPEAGLELLKRRMGELNSGPLPARPEGPLLQVDGGLRSAWTALKVGMSESDVTMLLGTPDRVEEGGAGPGRWIWGRPGTKGGWIAFDPAARTVKEWRTF